MLNDNMLHVWTVRLDQLEPDKFIGLLSADEHERKDRLVVESARWQFGLSRGVLRSVLSYYVHLPPEKIHFRYGHNGKPTLPNLEFNVSHSADVLLIALTNHAALGVDVEQIHPLPDMTIMARDNFSLNEQSALFALPENERMTAFFNCWTRKEAYIKATGDGFAMSLHHFDVTLDHPPRMTRAEGDDPARWTFYHLEPAPGYVGAVCVAEQNLALIEYQFMAD